MAAKDEQLSPEEKLLKVIQSDDGAKKGREKTPAATVVAEAPAVAAATPARPAEAKAEPAKPSLKLAKPAPAEAQPASAPAKTAPAAAKSATASAPAGKKAETVLGATPASPAASPASGKVRPAGFRIQTVTRLIGLAAVILLCLTAYEIWASIQTGDTVGSAVGVTPAPLPTGPGTEAQLPAMSQMLADFETRGLFRVTESGTTRTTIPPVVSEWQAYVKDNLDLIGTSSVEESGGGDEAILFDKKLNKLHILQIGQKITIAQQEASLVAIGTEDVTLSDGTDRVTVKAGR